MVSVTCHKTFYTKNIFFLKKNWIFFYIRATIHTCPEIQCLLYVGFFSQGEKVKLNPLFGVAYKYFVLYIFGRSTFSV